MKLITCLSIINDLINKHKFESYENLIQDLENIIIYTPLIPRNNPIYTNAMGFSSKEIEYFIGQYSQISNIAIHCLLESRLRTFKWEKLREEIDRNINEEKGSLTGQIPHLQIMRRGYLSDFNIDTDNVHINPITNAFLTQIQKIFQNQNHAFNAGAILAFESISSDEFIILRFLIEQHFLDTKTGHLRNANTKAYIENHIEFEIGHHEGLKKAIETYINKENSLYFAKGYIKVLLTMSNWWENITNEIFLNRIDI